LEIFTTNHDKFQLAFLITRVFDLLLFDQKICYIFIQAGFLQFFLTLKENLERLSSQSRENFFDMFYLLVPIVSEVPETIPAILSIFDPSFIDMILVNSFIDNSFREYDELILEFTEIYTISFNNIKFFQSDTFFGMTEYILDKYNGTCSFVYTDYIPTAIFSQKLMKYMDPNKKNFISSNSFWHFYCLLYQKIQEIQKIIIPENSELKNLVILCPHQILFTFLQCGINNDEKLKYIRSIQDEYIQLIDLWDYNTLVQSGKIFFRLLSMISEEELLLLFQDTFLMNIFLKYLEVNDKDLYNQAIEFLKRLTSFELFNEHLLTFRNELSTALLDNEVEISQNNQDYINFSRKNFQNLKNFKQLCLNK